MLSSERPCAKRLHRPPLGGLGDTAFDAAREHLQSAAYDLILLDLMLPDGLGIAFLKLRAEGSVTPVIILTALDQISDRIAGLDAGADDYMIKPFDLSELSSRLNAVAAIQRQPRSSHRDRRPAHRSRRPDRDARRALLSLPVANGRCSKHFCSGPASR